MKLLDTDGRTTRSIASELTKASAADRLARRLGLRQEIASLRYEIKQRQATARLVDAFAKLGGGSLLTATVLLMVNGQLALPVVVTASIALLLFSVATILLVQLDRHAADLDYAVEVIEAALKETER